MGTSGRSGRGPGGGAHYKLQSKESGLPHHLVSNFPITALGMSLSPLAPRDAAASMT